MVTQLLCISLNDLEGEIELARKEAVIRRHRVFVMIVVPF